MDRAKRQPNGMSIVATLPWPMGMALGLLGYIAKCHGIGWYFGLTKNPYTSGLGQLAASGIYAPLGWMLLIGCWIAALLSFLGRAAAASYSTTRPASTACAR